MILETLSQKKPVLIGFLQFICGFAYIALIATFFWMMSWMNVEPPHFIAPLLMITLLVFSATLMGIFFLGIPIYLILKNNWTKALRIIGYTLLFALITIITLVITIVLWKH